VDQPAAGQPVRLRDYELLELLGQGGMGAVYKALHLRLGKVVALKVLPARRLADAHAASRFDREMKAVGKLDHPHIVRATDAGEVAGMRYLVMEFVEGLDLSRISRHAGPLRVADACEIVRQAAEGLQHVHEAGLVHRDIKPSNLILTDTGQVKILDLGLALLREKGSEELTDSNQVVGTLDYMAPEQCTGSHAVDIRADLYSLAATLYKLLAGLGPFAESSSPAEKMQALINQPADSILGVRSDVPEELAAVCLLIHI
jgi:serine/threonine protein kinase